MEKEPIFLRDTAGNPERGRWRYLAHYGSQLQRRLGSSCSLTEQAI